MIELIVADIRNAQAPSEAYALVLKERHGTRLLPIVIGMSEARSIVLEMNKLKPKRPTTHDLFVQLAKECRVNAKEVEIYHFEDGIFYAHINLNYADGKFFSIDSRTSDAVVFALKYNIPIYIHEQILNYYISDNPIEEIIAPESTSVEEESDEELQLPADDYDRCRSANLEEMSLEELDSLLKGAIECEDFEMASKIHEEIEKRKLL